ncbi:hypothetical protein GMDG_02744 [Pseudogymnoascus destructans 20631-21]|uniref:Uncharacterized protein n=1 Tax=Pseudogymnoascus destructans (strain ATCC MYA-4855 / 20631-21) TaxID=658429 RepID=L8G3Y9_PSED2|nr:hypothetical protein GMDG_02744 [Pseudogymnoascus destructans 20631-21]
MKGLSPHMRPYYHPHSRMSGLPYKKKVTSSLKVCVSMKALVQHFLAVFPPDHFFEALTFLHHYVDIIRSSALGQCYMEGIYSHFRARAKLFLDWESDPEREVESPYTKARLVDFMEMFLVVPDYEQLERDDFYELTSKRINNRPGKPVEAHSLVRGTDFSLSRAVPPPSKRQGLGQRSRSARGQLFVRQSEWASLFLSLGRLPGRVWGGGVQL